MKKVLLGFSVGLFSITSAYANYPVLPDASMAHYGEVKNLFITEEEGFIPKTLYTIKCNLIASVGKVKTSYLQSFPDGKYIQTCNNITVNGKRMPDCIDNFEMSSFMIIDNVSVKPPYTSVIQFGDYIEGQNPTVVITCSAFLK